MWRGTPRVNPLSQPRSAGDGGAARDDVGGGFDNIGDVLTLPPLLMEKYLAAAERIADEAIVTDPSVFVKSQYRDRTQLQSQGQASYDRENRRWMVWSGGSVWYDFEFPRDGDYLLHAEARLPRGGEEGVQAELRVDGRPAQTFDIQPRLDGSGTFEHRARLSRGTHRVSRKAEWPSWTPPAEMLKRRPDLPRFMEGGPNNPLGARALYLGSTLYRIHGTNEPWSIGQNVSSGCIRMVNDDVVDLYERVQLRTKVVVL